MCQLLLSGIGYVPTLNVHSDVWNCVESYTIFMLLTCRLKITFNFSLRLIISFLVQLQHIFLPSLIVTSSQVRVGTPVPLLLCCISGLGPEDLLQTNIEEALALSSFDDARLKGCIVAASALVWGIPMMRPAQHKACFYLLHPQWPNWLLVVNTAQSWVNSRRDCSHIHFPAHAVGQCHVQVWRNFPTWGNVGVYYVDEIFNCNQSAYFALLCQCSLINRRTSSTFFIFLSLQFLINCQDELVSLLHVPTNVLSSWLPWMRSTFMCSMERSFTKTFVRSGLIFFGVHTAINCAIYVHGSLRLLPHFEVPMFGSSQHCWLLIYVRVIAFFMDLNLIFFSSRLACSYFSAYGLASNHTNTTK
jgi:hypothetical protein